MPHDILSVAPDAAGPRVLVVDDDPLLRRMIRLYLERCDARVTEVGRADEALQAVGRCDFDVVVTDVDMPGPSGLWLLERLRSWQPGLPVIVITGGMLPSTLDLPADARLTAEPDGAPVLRKPFRLDELAAEIRSVLVR